MFIDDTGEVDNAATNQPERRFASITGVIFDLDYYHNTFDPSFRLVKLNQFGNTKRDRPPILHRRALIDASGAFSCLADPHVRTAWDERCLSMYKRATYRVITTVVDKVAFYYHHPNWDGEIYSMLVQNAIERYFYFLRACNGVGDVMAESVGKIDLALKARYTAAFENGTEHISGDKLRMYLTSRELKVKPKSDDVSGLQMADLLAKPSFDHCRNLYAGGAPQKGFSAKVSALLEAEKYYRDDNGSPNGYGRVWRPKVK